jgi:hypothetical protein
MRDKNLERNIQELEEFIELWKRLSAYLDRGFNQQNFTGEEEQAFLELKSQIARQHEMLMTMLGNVAERDDKALRLLNTLPSLQAFKELPEGMARKVAGEWHGTFMGLQAMLGRLAGRREQLARISSLGTGVRRVFAQPAIILLLCVLAAYGVYRLGGDLVPWVERLTAGDTTK